MKPVDMKHMDHIEQIAGQDVEHLRLKEATYRGSWKARGGTGAFMMMARKWDRLDNMMEDTPGYDIFAAIKRDMTGADGTALAEVRDLRRYLLLVEAEMQARHIVGVAAKVVAETLAARQTTFDTVRAPPNTAVYSIDLHAYNQLTPHEQMCYDQRARDVFTLKDFLSPAVGHALDVERSALRSCYVYMHDIGSGTHLLDRAQLTPAELYQRRRWPIERNSKEFSNLVEPIRHFYDQDGSGGWTMHPPMQVLWGLTN